jgi:hypothetical protein
MGNNASKTPAPLVDRVKGSRTNKAGSAVSKKSAQGIKLNASIIAGLTKKAKEYNEKHPKGKVSVTTLKAVMRRGMGAYSSSHRPTITGGAPNTRQAWAYARVNAFLRKKGGQGAKPTYVQDNDLLEDGGLTKHGLHLIIKNINKENMYGGTYKKIFDVIDADVEFYNPFGTEYEELKGNDLHIFVTPRPDSHVIEKISKIKNVEVTDVEYTDVKNTDGYYADGGQLGKEITCVNCGWHWNTNDSDPSDKYVCHKCGYDNRTYYDKDPIGEYNKYEIYKSIGPLRQANETIEKIQSMESEIKMAHGGLTKSLAVADVHKKYPELPKSFINAQLYLGMKAEMEHTKNPDVAKKIALDHLSESPFYYEYLTKMEKQLKGLDVKEHYNEQKNYAKGGEINPDNKSVKDYFAHGSGNVGGVLVGKRHSEGGIKAVNKSTNQPLEMEGGEVVITRNAVSDNEKREFEGEMLTNKEILSRINESGGGVSFADGGDIPESIYTSGKEYAYGGKMVKDHDIVSSCGCKHSMADGGKLNTERFNEMFGHTFKNGGQIYGEGGMVRIINKEVPTYYGFQELFNGLKVPNLRKKYEGFLKENYKINFTQLPQKIRTGLLLGSQKLIDKYINK